MAYICPFAPMRSFILPIASQCSGSAGVFPCAALAAFNRAVVITVVWFGKRFASSAVRAAHFCDRSWASPAKAARSQAKRKHALAVIVKAWAVYHAVRSVTPGSRRPYWIYRLAECVAYGLVSAGYLP